jgi:hypothetical protein
MHISIAPKQTPPNDMKTLIRRLLARVYLQVILKFQLPMTSKIDF